jgi:hypothetical protein
MQRRKSTSIDLDSIDNISTFSIVDIHRKYIIDVVA